MAKISRLRKRSKKNKVSALDVFEEFEAESSNFFVEAKSKLSEEEQQRLRENYLKAEKQHLGIGLKSDISDTESIQNQLVDQNSNTSHIASESAQTGDSISPDPSIPYSEENHSETSDYLGNNKGTIASTERNESIIEENSIGEQLGNNLTNDLNGISLSASGRDEGVIDPILNVQIKEQLENNKGSIREQNKGEIGNNFNTNRFSKGNKKGATQDSSSSPIKLEMNAKDAHKSLLKNKPNTLTNKGAIREQDDHDLSFESNAQKPILGNIKGTEFSKDSELDQEKLNSLEKNIKGTIREQLGIYKGSLREQTPTIKGAIGEQLEINKGLNKGTLKGTIREQLGFEEYDSRVHLLVGNERRFIDYLFLKCLSLGSFDSGPVTMDEMTSKLGMNSEVLKMVIKRLCKKNFIRRTGGKRGKGGFTQFTIGKDLYQRMLLDREITRESAVDVYANMEQLGNNKGSNKGTIKGTTPSSSSSYNFNNTNTTTSTQPVEPPKVGVPELPQDWIEIHTPENVKNIGFGQTQINQLYRLGTFSAFEVQESLEAFSYDLETDSVRSRGSKLGFLMGILRGSGAYVSEGLVNEMKSQIESNEKRRKELADLEKKKAQEILTTKAQGILEKMSEEEKQILVPPTALAKTGSVIHEKLLIGKILEKLSQS